MLQKKHDAALLTEDERLKRMHKTTKGAYERPTGSIQ